MRQPCPPLSHHNPSPLTLGPSPQCSSPVTSSGLPHMLFPLTLFTWMVSSRFQISPFWCILRGGFLTILLNASLQNLVLLSIPRVLSTLPTIHSSSSYHFSAIPTSCSPSSSSWSQAQLTLIGCFLCVVWNHKLSAWVISCADSPAYQSNS